MAVGFVAALLALRALADGFPTQTAPLTLLTNTPTPHRMAFLNSFAARARQDGITLDVPLLRASQTTSAGDLHLEEQQFPWRILAGVHPRVGDAVPTSIQDWFGTWDVALRPGFLPPAPGTPPPC